MVVTVEVLEEILEQKLDERFSEQDEGNSRMFMLMIEKLDMVLFGMDQYRQETQALSQSIIKNERKVEDLDMRVLKLEVVK